MSAEACIARQRFERQEAKELCIIIVNGIVVTALPSFVQLDEELPAVIEQCYPSQSNVLIQRYKRNSCVRVVYLVYPQDTCPRYSRSFAPKRRCFIQKTEEIPRQAQSEYEPTTTIRATMSELYQIPQATNIVDFSFSS